MFFHPVRWPLLGSSTKLRDITVPNFTIYVSWCKSECILNCTFRRDGQILDTALSPKRNNSCCFWIKHNVGVQLQTTVVKTAWGKKNVCTDSVSTRSDTIFLGKDIVWNSDILIDDIDVISKTTEYRYVPRKTILFYLIKFCLDFFFFYNKRTLVNSPLLYYYKRYCDFPYNLSQWRRLGQAIARLLFENEVWASGVYEILLGSTYTVFSFSFVRFYAVYCYKLYSRFYATVKHSQHTLHCF